MLQVCFKHEKLIASVIKEGAKYQPPHLPNSLELVQGQRQIAVAAFRFGRKSWKSLEE